MKRVLVFLFLAMAVLSFAAPVKLTVVTTGPYKFFEGEDFRGYPTAAAKMIGEFEKANPGYKVEFIIRDLTHGSMTVDALMAAGTPPDVWVDASGYFDKYLNANYAIPLEKYIDVKQFQKNLVDIYTREGHVYGIPTANICGGFAINLSMLESIGYTMPEQKNWTTDEFMKLSALLKAKGIPSTMVMGKGGMGTWNNVFLYAFGAKFFNGRDYSKTVINTKEAVAGLNYIKALVDAGYAYPNAIEQNDDMGVDLFTTGKVFSCMMQNGHTDYWIPEQVKQGKLEKEFKYTFVEVPHAPGRAHTPVYGYQTIVVAHTSKNAAKDKVIADLAYRFLCKEFQFYEIGVGGGFSTINGFAPVVGASARDSYKAINVLASTAGLMEDFPPGDKGAEVDRIWSTYSEQFLRGKIEAQDMLNKFEAEANKALAK